MAYGGWNGMNVALVAGGLLLAGCQKSDKVLVVIDSTSGEPYTSSLEATKKGLRERGFVEGDNLKIIHENVNGDNATARNTVVAAAASNPDAILLNGTYVTIVAHGMLAGSDQKFVFSCVTDPVGGGIIDEFDASPPRNFTGVSYAVPVQTRFNIIAHRLPHKPPLVIGMIQTDTPQAVSYWKMIQKALEGPNQTTEESKTHARMTGMVFEFRTVPYRADDVDQMVADAETYVRELDPTVDVFVGSSDPLATSREFVEMISTIATKPYIGLGRVDVTDHWGAVGSVYPSTEDIGDQAASMIVRLFGGEDIKDIYPETPRRTGYAISVGRAKAFGVDVTQQEWKNLIRPEDMVD